MANLNRANYGEIKDAIKEAEGRAHLLIKAIGELENLNFQIEILRKRIQRNSEETEIKDAIEEIEKSGSLCFGKYRDVLLENNNTRTILDGLNNQYIILKAENNL